MSAVPCYLLDTNIVSETRKVRADPRVTEFLAGTDASGLFLSVLTIGELRRGLEIKRRSDREAATRLGVWVEGLESTFADRVLAVDARIARRWGELAADRSRPVIDTLIAATALVHGLTLVTRNTADLEGIELAMINPWQTSSAGRTK